MSNFINSYYEKFDDGTVKCIDEEIPFEIPQGWEWCRFSSIYWQLTDGVHSTPQYTEAGIPFLSVKNISSGKLSLVNTKFISEDEHKLLSRRCNPQKGDLLISKVGTTGIPLIIDIDKPFSIFVSLALIKFFSKYIDSDFLVHLIESPLIQEQVRNNTRGVGNKNWVLTAIANTLLLVPPLEEQKRIVAKLNKIQSCIDKYKGAQNKLKILNNKIGDKLRQSILQEAIQGKLVLQIGYEGTAQELLEQIQKEKRRLVKEGKLKKSTLNNSVIFKGDDNKYYERINGKIVCINNEIPFDVPETWLWCRLGTIFDHNTGKALNTVNREGQLLRYITTSNLYWGYFDLSNVKQMYFKESEIEKCTVQKGDLLICEGGDIGRAAIWEYGYTICIQNHIHRLRSFTPLSIDFYYYVFQTYKGIGLIGGKGIGIQGLSSKALHNILMPLPPIDEQKRIVTQISKLLQYIQ